jgi:predicted outer membrane protein
MRKLMLIAAAVLAIGAASTGFAQAAQQPDNSTYSASASAGGR